VASACVSSRCGDGYKDTATGEECEDGNMAAGDGCASCRFECKTDMDCDDGRPCNGAETCDKTMAAAGKQLCKAGAAAANGTACTTEGAAGTCMGGNCMKAGCGNGAVEAGEECDDMNADDADGCTRACKFTCKRPLTAATATCAPASSPATHHAQVRARHPGHLCHDGRCTAAGTCTPATGACVYPDADMDGKACSTDCNDADPAVFPGASNARTARTTTATPPPPMAPHLAASATWTPTATATRSAPPGPSLPRRLPGRLHSRGAHGRDQHRLRRAGDGRPSRTGELLPTPYCPLQLGGTCLSMTRSFDYNCDMMETPFDNSMAAATCVGATRIALLCTLRSGWVTTVPACGAKGTYRHAPGAPASAAAPTSRSARKSATDLAV
jgi:cysteine-rich repeat protein